MLEDSPDEKDEKANEIGRQEQPAGRLAPEARPARQPPMLGRGKPHAGREGAGHGIPIAKGPIG